MAQSCNQARSACSHTRSAWPCRPLTTPRHHAASRRLTQPSASSSSSSSGVITDIHYFPIKGLPHVALPSVHLEEGGCIPHDREWAVMMGCHAHEWDPSNPKKLFIEKGYRGEHHGTKLKFHQLMTAEELASLHMDFDPASQNLVLRRKASTPTAQASTAGQGSRGGAGGNLQGGGVRAASEVLLDVSLSSSEGVQEAEAFFDALLGDKVRPSQDGQTRLKLVHAAQGITHQFANVGGTSDMLLLHLISRTSAADLEAKAAAPIDPLRYRANIIFDGLPAWEEWAWPGRLCALGEAQLLITEPTIRCPATQVDPASSQRDMLPPQDPPGLLKRLYPGAESTLGGEKRVALGGPNVGAGYFGLYARVVKGGKVQVGDGIQAL